MGLFHQHHWAETNRVHDVEGDQDVVELQCDGCGELRNQHLESTHQHTWDPKPVHTLTRRQTEVWIGQQHVYNLYERVVVCTSCGAVTTLSTEI